MSTPGISWTWDDDMSSFLQDADDHTDAVTDKTNDTNAYYAQIQVFTDFIDTHSPEESLLFFFYWIATAADPNTKDNILGLYDDQTNVIGKSMSASAGQTTLTSDLQNLFDDTIDQSSVPIAQQCQVADDSLTQLIDKFQNDPDVSNSFDSSTVNGIIQQLQDMQANLRQYFTFTSSSGSFSTGSLTSFDDMKNQMSSKTSDTSNATTAAQGFTDALQTLTSETQNFNAAMNQQVSFVTGMEKDWQSALGSFMKSMLDETNAVIQNMTKA